MSDIEDDDEFDYKTKYAELEAKFSKLDENYQEQLTQNQLLMTAPPPEPGRGPR